MAPKGKWHIFPKRRVGIDLRSGGFITGVLSGRLRPAGSLHPGIVLSGPALTDGVTAVFDFE